MLKTLLLLHILGATYTAFLLLQSGIAIYQSKLEKYKQYAIQIMILLLVQVVSGCILSLETTHTATLTDFCSRIGIYFASILTMESILLWEMNKVKLSFPKLLISSLGTLSFLITVSTAIYIY